MELKDIFIITSVCSIMLISLFLIVGSNGLKIPTTDPTYNRFIQPIQNNLSSFTTEQGNNITNTLESTEVESTVANSNDVTLLKSAWKVIKLVLDTPRIVYNVVTTIGTALNVPAIIVGLILSFIILMIAFMIFSIITRY